MKLLVLHDKPRGEIGGMNTFIAAQNALLVQAGHEIQEIICTPEPQTEALHLKPNGRRVGRRAVQQLSRLLSRADPNALIAHSPYYALGPATLRWLQGRIPSIYVLHDVTPLCPRETRLTRAGELCGVPQGFSCVSSGCYRIGDSRRPISDTYGLLMRGLQMHAARTVRQWVVPSRYLAELLEVHGVAGDRIAIVPPFAWPVPSRDVMPVPGRLLYAGRLVAEKGVRLLFDALRVLNCAEWSLDVAGAGPERGRLEQFAEQHGWAARIRWLDSLSADALAAQYAQAEVVVMPSLIPESFGLVGLEAMSHARPVVGFGSGGMSEWLRDGITGKLARWGDPVSLAAAIDALLLQPGYARQLGLRARVIATCEFSPAAHLRRMHEVIASTLAEHPSRMPQAAAAPADTIASRSCAPP